MAWMPSFLAPEPPTSPEKPAALDLVCFSHPPPLRLTYPPHVLLAVSHLLRLFHLVAFFPSSIPDRNRAPFGERTHTGDNPVGAPELQPTAPSISP